MALPSNSLPTSTGTTSNSLLAPRIPATLTGRFGTRLAEPKGADSHRLAPPANPDNATALNRRTTG